MKLRTSYFNPEALRKNVTRFAPAWALYTLFWLMLVFMMQDGNRWPDDFARNMGESLQFTPVFNLGYALLCAQLLFGDLYNGKMCNALHAMPLRREGWFLTNVASGILFGLVPNLAVTLVSCAFTGEYWMVAPLWLAGNTLQYLFFFGVAVLSAYCVGNRFAMALVYAIINFFSLIAYWLIESLYVPMLYGIVIDLEPFYLFSPVYKMVGAGDYILVSYDLSIVKAEEGWGYLAVCAGIGVALMGIALLLYRRRNLECAGDFVAVKALGPVFLILYCLCGGAVSYLFFSLFVGDESLFFLVIGMTVGWFTGHMLLARTVRVFGKKKLIGWGALILIFFATLGLTKLDPLGITRWVPQAQQVESVMLNTGVRYNRGEDAYVLTDPADIESILSVHRYGIDNPDADYNGKADVQLTISYRLKSGRTVSRSYAVDVDTTQGNTLKSLLSRKEFVLGTKEDAQTFARSLMLIYTERGMKIQGEDMAGLLEAMMQDCAAGNMAQESAFYQSGGIAEWLTLQVMEDDQNTFAWMVRVYKSSENTLAWLEAHEMLLEQEDKYSGKYG
ncbi:MAG: hypothetical protein J6Q53_07025 [Oscillospiraceae bacterium]|nr:hypothetical protein [Oscillospiraceae bacterium]